MGKKLPVWTIARRFGVKKYNIFDMGQDNGKNASVKKDDYFQ